MINPLVILLIHNEYNLNYKKTVASENIIYIWDSEINSRKQIFNFSDARTVSLSPIWHLLKLVKPFPLCNWASPLCQPSWSWTTITVVSSVLRNMKLRSLNPLEHSNWRYNIYLFLKARGKQILPNHKSWIKKLPY